MPEQPRTALCLCPGGVYESGTETYSDKIVFGMEWMAQLTILSNP